MNSESTDSDLKAVPIDSQDVAHLIIELLSRIDNIAAFRGSGFESLDKHINSFASTGIDYFDQEELSDLRLTYDKLNEAISDLFDEYHLNGLDLLDGPMQLVQQANKAGKALETLSTVDDTVLKTAVDLVKARQDREQKRLSRFKSNQIDHDSNATQHPMVFIGHGHSPYWRELRDYVKETLKVDTFYYESTSRVGEHMIEILEGRFASANCAVIILSQDDMQPDGGARARQNVVHEVGFFQGKLGFRRVAMVIQRGLEEFSNVAGVTPIYYEGRHIRMAFPDLQSWLQREFPNTHE